MATRSSCSLPSARTDRAAGARAPAFNRSTRGFPVFADFALHERLLKAVAELNFTEPTPVQREAIPPALAGRDLRVIAQTGSGKTAAFVLPVLNRLIGDAEQIGRASCRERV